MVSRLTLIFWRWVATVHNRLHAAQDKDIGEAIAEKDETWRFDNFTYTSPSVPYSDD